MNWGYTRSWAASLEWGDWPAWLACLFAAIALWISIRAQKDGRRSANASETSASAAQASVTAAQASVEEARLSRLASERSADVAEETLADQRREAAQRRAAEEEANRPRPSFQVERPGIRQFRLRNVGTGPAVGIAIIARPAPFIWGNHTGVSLEPGEAYSFPMAAAGGAPMPGTLYITWDGQDEEVALAVPG